MIPQGYDKLFRGLKEHIEAAQAQAGVAVNRERVLLYWRVGQDILERENQSGDGSKVIDRLAIDLRSEFPEMSGISPRYLEYMRAFAEAWPERSIVHESLAQLNWYSNIALLEKLSTGEERLWYASQAIAGSWSTNVLVREIEADLFRNQRS